MNSTIVGIHSYNGFIIPHSKKIKHLTNSYPWGLGIDYSWQLMKEETWQYCFCYPKTGFSVLYVNFANKEVLGATLAAYAFIEPVLGAGRKFSYSARFGIGPAYLNHVFDSIDNPENRFYSSAISFIALLNVNAFYTLSDKASLGLTAEFNHISNGGIKNPNLGINFPTFGFAFYYNVSPKPYLHQEKDKSSLVEYKHRVDISWLSGAKTALKGEEKYYIPGFIATYAYAYGRMSAVSFSGEFTFDFAEKEVIHMNNLKEDSSYIDYKYASIMAANEVLLGKFIFYQQLGVYLYAPYKRMDPLFQRYGISYYLTDKFFIDINLKVHRHEADFLAMRFGYSLFR